MRDGNRSQVLACWLGSRPPNACFATLNNGICFQHRIKQKAVFILSPPHAHIWRDIPAFDSPRNVRRHVAHPAHYTRFARYCAGGGNRSQVLACWLGSRPRLAAPLASETSLRLSILHATCAGTLLIPHNILALLVIVRVGGIEPPTQHWKCRILPLNYTRVIPFRRTNSDHATILRNRNTPKRFCPRLFTLR